MTAPAIDEGESAVLDVVRDLVTEVRSSDEAATVELDSELERQLGLDSLALAELLVRVEDVFDVSLPSGALARVETPRDVLAAVHRGHRRTLGRAKAVLPGAHPFEVEHAPDHAETLVEVLDWHVHAHLDRLHVRVLGDAGPEDEMTYAELLDGAARVAGGLLARDLAPGESVALMMPTCREYFSVFAGVLLAGGVPVPVYPPVRLSQLEDHLHRQVRTLENARAALLVTVPEAKRLARLVRARVDTLREVVTPAELAVQGPMPVQPEIDAAGVALLQYTSGSTGNPKGVVLTHADLLANIRAMGRVGHAGASDIFVSWLPLYHDMGLIGAWLGSLYYGMPLVVMSPATFLARPSRWLWAIHEHRGTLSAAPNFAYELCLRKIDDQQIEGLDLSSWRLAFNGAEPVSPDTVEHFAERFAPYGLHREAIAPVYGLAEACVGLAFPPPGRGAVIDRIARDPFVRSGRAVPATTSDSSTLRFVSCGLPLPGHEIRVVDSTGNELGERHEGRIEFRGPSATSGYIRNPSATRALFHGEWLESGDLGYVAAGDLHVTGRVKDLIIGSGRNLHPEELEEAVGDIDGIRKGCVGVFATTDSVAGTERLVVVAETRQTEPDERANLRARVAEATVDLLGTPPDEVVLARAGAVLKTSSGKIRRAACRELYESGTIDARHPPVWWQLARLRAAGTLGRLRRAGRVVSSVSFAAWCWVLLVDVGIPTLLAVAALPRRQWRWRVARRAARSLARLSSTTVTVHGIELLHEVEPAVIVANHPSYLDPIALATVLPGPHTFVAGEVFARKRVIGFLLRRLGVEFVERVVREQGVADAQRLAAVARRGDTLVLFPEGGLARVPGLRPFHSGAFVIAATTGRPLVPIAIRGSRSMLRPGHRFVRRGGVHVIVTDPLVPAGADWEAAVELERAARIAILRRCGEPDLA
jgi:1-acyl-sn-glycerol-3-phosphate acyltransferase